MASAHDAPADPPDRELSGVRTPTEPPRPDLPPTERRLPASSGLDEMGVEEVLALLNEQDTLAPAAVRAAIPDLARLVDVGVEVMRASGRIHYFGAGTSGRLAVLDAAELIPTFGLEPDRVVAHIAGGAAAIQRPVESAEDQADEGAAVVAHGVDRGDLVIGVTASGNTPYVLGALRQAARQSSARALISCNPAASAARWAQIHVCLDTGPEVVTGSTRLKAGTAQKLALNSFSTSVMIRLGRTWSNLMVSMLATNDKLRRRTVRTLAQATDLSPEESVAALERAGGDLRVAVVATLTGAEIPDVRRALEANAWSVRDAIATLPPPSTAPSASAIRTTNQKETTR